MIEKLSFFRNIYELDCKKWKDIEYIKKVYEETLNSYPMVNLGKITFYGGALVCFFATTQVFENPVCIVQQVAGAVACASGCSIALLPAKQFENYINHIEAGARLKKYGIKKEIDAQLKSKEKEL